MALAADCNGLALHRHAYGSIDVMIVGSHSSSQAEPCPACAQVRLGLVAGVTAQRIATYAKEPLPQRTRSGCAYLMQVFVQGPYPNLPDPTLPWLEVVCGELGVPRDAPAQQQSHALLWTVSFVCACKRSSRVTRDVPCVERSGGAHAAENSARERLPC